MSDAILNVALRDLIATDEDVDTAEQLLKVLAEAGEDVTDERANLTVLKGRRNKLIISLKNNGASE